MLPAAMTPYPEFRLFFYDLLQFSYMCFCNSMIRQASCMIKQEFNIQIIISSLNFLNMKKTTAISYFEAIFSVPV